MVQISPTQYVLIMVTEIIANFYFIDSSADDICSDEFALSPSTFTKNGNTLKFYNNGVLTATYTITELTTTSLKISTTYTGGSRFTEFSSI